MSDTATQAPPTEGRDDIKALREAADRGREAVAEADRLRKENLFIRAGVDPGLSKLHQLFYDSYQGDDIEALRTEATELRLLGAPEAPPPAADPNAAAAQGFREQFAGAGRAPDPVGTETPHPIEAAFGQFHQDLAAGMTRERAQDRAMMAVMSAGLSGDKRALFDPAAYAEEAREHSIDGRIL